MRVDMLKSFKNEMVSFGRFLEISLTNPHFITWNKMSIFPSSWGEKILENGLSILQNGNVNLQEIKRINEHFNYLTSFNGTSLSFNSELNYKLIYDYLLSILPEVDDFSVKDLEVLKHAKKYIDVMYETLILYEGINEFTKDDRLFSPKRIPFSNINSSHPVFDGIFYNDGGSLCLPFGKYSFLRMLQNIYSLAKSNTKKWQAINKCFENFANYMISKNLNKKTHKIIHNGSFVLKKGIEKEVDLIIIHDDHMLCIEHKSQIIDNDQNSEKVIENIISDSANIANKWMTNILNKGTQTIKYADGSIENFKISTISTIFCNLQNFLTADNFESPTISLDRLYYLSQLFSNSFVPVMRKILEFYNKKSVKNNCKTTYSNKEFFASIQEVFTYKRNSFWLESIDQSSLVHLDFWDYDTAYIDNATFAYTRENVFANVVHDLMSASHTLFVNFDSKKPFEDAVNYDCNDKEIQTNKMSNMYQKTIKQDWMAIELVAILRTRNVADNEFARHRYSYLKTIHSDLGEFVNLHEY